MFNEVDANQQNFVTYFGYKKFKLFNVKPGGVFPPDVVLEGVLPRVQVPAELATEFDL